VAMALRPHGFDLFLVFDFIWEEIKSISESPLKSSGLYGLKQAPKAWYECFSDFFIENSFRIGKADSTLFTRKMGNGLFVCQIHVDDIILTLLMPLFVKSLARV
jgi:hypothetical protein